VVVVVLRVEEVYAPDMDIETNASLELDSLLNF